MIWGIAMGMEGMVAKFMGIMVPSVALNITENRSGWFEIFRVTFLT
jgi:hypothetical protein